MTITVRLPVLVHWGKVGWVQSSGLSAHKMYLKTLWRWQVGHIVVMVLPRVPRWRKQPW